MSLARALTTRRKEEPAATPAYIGRAASQRAPNAKPIKRSEISLPVNLISTTNMLSYEAPDIPDAPHVTARGGRYFSPSNMSVGSSANSDNESDHTGSVHSRETDATSIDMSSPETPPLENFNSSPYFKPGSQRLNRSTTSSHASHSTSRSTTYSHQSRPSFDSESPRLPSRAPSHSKSAHVLAHKRSVQRMATIPSEVKTSHRDTMDMFSASAINGPTPPTAPATNPFGKELEQLNEAAEEFSYAVRNAEADADQAIMRAKGLIHFCANDYMSEISSLYSTAFEEDAAAYQPMIWI